MLEPKYQGTAVALLLCSIVGRPGRVLYIELETCQAFMLALASLSRAKASNVAIVLIKTLPLIYAQLAGLRRLERKMEDELVIRDSMAATSTRTKVWTTDKYSSMFPVFLSR